MKCTILLTTVFSVTLCLGPLKPSSQYVAYLRISCRVLAGIFAIGDTLCIINDFGGLVNNGCGQIHVHELQVAIQRSKAKQTLVKDQLTLFGEQASSDIDNLGKVRADGVFCEYTAKNDY